MSNINFNEFKKGKLVVLCETENDFNNFVYECEINKIHTSHVRDAYKFYNENVCFRYDCGNLFYADKKYYEEEGFNIVKYVNETPMEILLTAENNEYGYGVAVKTENNEIYIKVGNRLLNEDGWLDFRDYDNNLWADYAYEDEEQYNYNIKEIMLIKTIFSTRNIKNGEDIEVESIWKREKERIMTLEEIEKELGCKIRIVEK